MAGNLRHAQVLPEDERRKLLERPVGKVENEKLFYVISEDVLYIHETDHLVQKVYFVGKKNVYFVEYADTYQTMAIFENAEYFIPMWMDTLAEDRYELILEVNGELQNTKKYIKVG